MTKAADGRTPMFDGFGAGEATEPSAFGKTALALAAVIAISIGGWLSLRPAPTEAADEGHTSDAVERAAPDDSTPADDESPATVPRTETPAAKAPIEPQATAAPEPVRTPVRKRAPRPKGPPPPAKPRQTSGMGPL